MQVAEAEPATITETRPHASQRLHYLDNLRAVAMLLGVYLHAALAYAHPSQSVWLATDTRSSVVVDASVWFIHLFRMALFFLLSGYFAELVLKRKGLRSFLVGRGTRVVLPFVLFYPFLLAAMTLVIFFALAYLKEPQGMMGLIAEAARGKTETGEAQQWTLMHLWFLYYLAAFTLIGVVFSSFKLPRFNIIDAVSQRPLWIGLSPLLLAPAAWAGGTPLPAPESFVPEWWPFAFYGFFYFTGSQLYGRESRLERMQPYVWHFLAASAVLFVPFYLLMPELALGKIIAGATAQPDWQIACEACLTAYLAVLLTITALLIGQRYLANQNSTLRFMADASYWIYLIHLPIVLFLQTLLVPFDWPLIVKFIAVLVGTMIPCLATYLVFVRYTPIGWMLHGKRSFP